MEPVLALNYPVPMFDELLGFFGSGSEPGSIPGFCSKGYFSSITPLCISSDLVLKMHLNEIEWFPIK